MTYNTKIYNYKNLHTDDKQIVQAQLLMFTEYTYSKEACTNTLETISYEEGIKALEDAKEKMYSDIVEYTWLPWLMLRLVTQFSPITLRLPRRKPM